MWLQEKKIIDDHLVNRWRDFREGKNFLNLSWRKIANANGFGKSEILTLFHCFPNGLDINCAYAIFWNRDFEMLLVEL